MYIFGPTTKKIFLDPLQKTNFRPPKERGQKKFGPPTQIFWTPFKRKFN